MRKFADFGGTMGSESMESRNSPGRIPAWNATTSSITSTNIKRFSFDLHETRGFLVDKRNPGIIILVWVADVNVSLRDELLNRGDDFGAILTRGDLGWCRGH